MSNKEEENKSEVKKELSTKEKVEQNAELAAATEFIHFACTSEDYRKGF